MTYFLIVYERKSGTLEKLKEYPEDQGELALRERFRIEAGDDNGKDLEVVVLGGESLETIKTTHARYFKTAQATAASAG